MAAGSISSALADYRQRQAVAALKAGRITVVEAAARSASAAPPPSSYEALLTEKDAQCRQILRGYGAALEVENPTETLEAQAAIEAWKENHASVWGQIRDRIIAPDALVPEADVMALPAHLLRAYVIGLYQDAHASLSMYQDGTWAELVASGQYQAAFVRDDAAARADLYDTILSLEETGALAAAFTGVQRRGLRGLLGLGNPIAIGEGALIVLGVAVAILAVGAAISSIMTTKSNNEVKKLCCARYLETNSPELAKCCKPDETDNVKIAKYGIAAAGLVLFGYLMVGQLPQIRKALSLPLMASTYATRALSQALPPPAKSGPTLYSVPRPSGGYEYYQAPPGLGVPLNDDFPVPTVTHPNPIGVSILTLGRPLPPGSFKVGEGSVAKGSITPMPGVRSDGPLTSGLGNDALSGFGGGFGFADTTDADLDRAQKASAFAIGLTCAIAAAVVWKASR